MSVNTKVNGQLVKSAGLYSVTAPIGMADIYSTEEKEVGVNFDGRPIYQKSWVLSSEVSCTSQSFTSLGIDASGIETVVGQTLQNSGGTLWDCVGINKDTNTNYFGVLNTRNATIGVKYVTLQYTKTNDTPWSGKFVPQGYGYVSSGDIYSEQERQVGVYIDGKPLYQKTIDFGALPNATTKSVAHSVSDLDIICDMQVIAYNIGENDSTFLPIPMLFSTQSVSANSTISVNKTNVTITSGTNLSMYDNAKVTIKYTKTTDVAGSGEYVPSGDKAEHYSTDEEVIGTWIDGKTLYRRVITINSPTSTLNYHEDAFDDIDSFFLQGGYYDQNGVQIALNSYEDSTHYTRTGYRGGTLHDIYFRTSNYSFNSVCIIIAYTKTS